MSNLTEIERSGSAVIIRFTRSEMRNPLSVRVLEELTRHLAELPENSDRIIFTGISGVFASGADLREIAEISASGAKDFALRGQHLMKTIAAQERVTIAAVNGFCFGGALDLALACKIRIAAPCAVFSHPGTSLGIITGWGGTQRLPRLIGRANALEMFMSAARVDAETALRIGLVDEIAENCVERAQNCR